MTIREVRASLVADLDAGISAQAAKLTTLIADSFGEVTAAIIHYGSQAHTDSPKLASTYDFFVIVDDNAAAYRAFTARQKPRFSARTATILAGLLPPSIIGVTLSDEGSSDALRGKCAVLSLSDFVVACAPGSKDHFTRGRLFQPARLAWVRDHGARLAVEDALIAARSSTFEWVRPHLPATFDTAAYCRTLLATSYAAEIRAETNDRHAEVFAAERSLLVSLYDALLTQLVADGVLQQEGNVYRQTRAASPLERARVSWYFRRSKGRAMLRWGKSILLYDRWLDYLREKAERRTGRPIELSPRERRWPLIFLWPKAVRLMTSRR